MPQVPITEVFGYAAAACTTLAFAPQAVRVWRTRSAGDISLSMYVIFICGIVMWAVYGLRIHSMPVIVANSATLLLAGSVLVAKFRFPDSRK
jgi:MtN3 and saliva related transmembrane protein